MRVIDKIVKLLSDGVCRNPIQISDDLGIKASSAISALRKHGGVLRIHDWGESSTGPLTPQWGLADGRPDEPKPTKDEFLSSRGRASIRGTVGKAHKVAGSSSCTFEHAARIALIHQEGV